MTRIRSAFTAISSRMKPTKDEASDAAAAGVGMSILSVIAALTFDGRGWQFTFAFMAGILATMGAHIIGQPLVRQRGKRNALHEMQEIREEMRELVAVAEAAGYRRALRDIEEAVNGGDRR